MRLAASFTASFVGWCATVASYCIWMGYFTRWGRVTDWNFFLIWPAVIVVIAWLLIAAPLTQLPALQRYERSPLTVAGLGAATAALAYALLVLTWAPVPGFIIFAVIVGAVAGLTYSLLLTFRVPPVWSLCACPAALAFWVLLMLPLLTRLAPEFVYRVSSGQRQAYALEQLLHTVPVGASWSDVQSRFPMLGMSGSSGRLDYTIHIDPTSQRVTAVDVRPRFQ